MNRPAARPGQRVTVDHLRPMGVRDVPATRKVAPTEAGILRADLAFAAADAERRRKAKEREVVVALARWFHRREPK